MNKKYVKITMNFIAYLVLIGIIISLLIDKNFIMKNGINIIKQKSETEQVTNLQKQLDALNSTQTEYANYIQSCKTQIATVLTNQGVVTSSEEKLETMAENISKILQARTSDATATEEDILEGKTAYVNGELITGVKDMNYYYELGKSEASTAIMKAMYNSNTVTKNYSGCSSGAGSWKDGTDSDSDACSGVIPLTYEENGKYYLLNSVTSGAASGHRNNCNCASSWGAASINFYTYDSKNGKQISNIGSATGGNESGSHTGYIGPVALVSVALFEKDIAEEADSVYYYGATSASVNSPDCVHSYGAATGSGQIQTIVATYIELTV